MQEFTANGPSTYASGVAALARRFDIAETAANWVKAIQTGNQK